MTGRSGIVGYPMGLLVALAIHAGVLFGWHQSQEPITPPEFGVEVASPGVEVTLVAALPDAEEEPSAEETKPAPEPEKPEPTPPPVEPEPIPEPTPEPLPPEPEPTPIVQETPPEVTTPVQPSPTPAPTPSETPPPKPKPTAPARPKPKPKPPRPKSPHGPGDGSSAIPGADATTAAAATGAQSAQPGYLRNPHPAYPEEARKAGQEGVVQLRVSVDERGHVTGVVVTRSSGHPLLDERARSTVSERWVFKPARRGSVAVATTVIVPIRFSLTR